MKKADENYWFNKSMEERFKEAERLRREFYKKEYGKSPRIQKIIHIFKKGKLVKIINARDEKILLC